MESDRSSPPAAAARIRPRPARQPTRTRLTAFILAAFMLIVWFVGPAQLPVFFQRLVGLVNALLAMLLVVFAIREYGKKYNRLRWPLVGRVSTSKVAGTLVFAAVVAWWLSPWAPIAPGEVEPDLWNFLERGLDDPVLVLVDRDSAMIAPPSPSAAARRAADDVNESSPAFSRALAAVANRQFDSAAALLDGLDRQKPRERVPKELIGAARAQVDLYTGQFAAARGRYAELLRSEPRREDYLTHGALAAILAGDDATAGDWARQLLDQAAGRSRDSLRYRQAVNLLAAIRIVEGKYAEAERLMAEPKATRDRAAPVADHRPQFDRQLAIDENNGAVLRVLTGPPNAAGLSAGFVSARTLWLEWNEFNGRPRDLPDVGVAVAQHNLGMVALVDNRFEQAEELFTDALAAERRAAARSTGPIIGATLCALADIARIEADRPRAESYLSEADDMLPSASPARTAWLATRAALDADLGRFDQAIAGYKAAIQSIERIGPHRPFAAVLKIRLADVEQDAGRLDEAEASVRDGLAGLDFAGLDRTTTRANGLRVLGTIEVSGGHLQTARQQFDAAARILEPAAQLDERQTEPPLETLGLAALKAARASAAESPEAYPAAIADCEAAIAIVQKVLGSRAPHHPLTAHYQHVLAKIDIRRGKLLAAEQLLRQALAIDEAALPKNHPATIAVLDDLAQTLEQSGRPDEGRAMADRAKALRAGRTSSH